MKRLFILFLFLLCVSCSEDENNTPDKPIDDTFDPTKMGVTLLRTGMLVGVGHTVSGTAKVYDDAGKKIVVLDPFASQNGPDLKVYLSTDEKASKYVNLGALKSTTGKQSYGIDGMPNLNEYKFILVWCQDFSVLFGKAELN